jgi:hypothetical protein
MKAYAFDVRSKVLTSYHRQEGSIRQLAKRFTVSRRCVGELIARCRRTGSSAPQPPGGGNPPRIDAQGRQVVDELVPSQPDATLDELGHHRRHWPGLLGAYLALLILLAVPSVPIYYYVEPAYKLPVIRVCGVATSPWGTSR